MKGNYGVLLGTLVIGAALGGLAVAAVMHPAGQTPSVQKLREGSSMPADIGHAKYENPTLGFSLVYPIELVLQEFPAGGDATTIVFQDPKEEKGFQIYVFPYAGDQIKEDRIREDLAGAPMQNVTQIVLPGNIQAVHFESHAPIIGDSSEVWFLHNGYLYEVTTYRADDTWLASILSTLTFTK